MREITVGSQYKSYLNVQEQSLKRVRVINIVEGEKNSLGFQLLTINKFNFTLNLSTPMVFS